MGEYSLTLVESQLTQSEHSCLSGTMVSSPLVPSCIRFVCQRFRLTTGIETDSTEFSSMSEDFHSTQTFRDRTLAFVRTALGFGEQPTANDSCSKNDTVINCFDVVGKAVVDSYSPSRAFSSLFCIPPKLIAR